jgi:hypothetical protein
MSINAKDYGAIGNGIADDTAALQLSINTAYSMQTSLYIPAGNYLVSATLNMPFNSGATYNQGNYIYGDGMFNTIITATAASVIIFNYIQPITYQFMLGGCLQDMSLNGGGLAETIGISMQAVFQTPMKNLEISGFQYGVQLVNTSASGDGDACNHIIFDNCLIQNCFYWGVFNNIIPGNNETSFLSFRDTTIQSCGTATGAIGGGMYWRGQMLQFDNCAFVTNQNRGLYIEGGAGLGSNVLLNSVTFENNTGMHLQCYGIVNLEFNNLQMYSNDSFKAQYGIYLTGASYLVSQVRVNSAKVRATSGNNPYTAFFATGANAVTTTIIVDSKQVRWDNFGYTGQTQYSGFTVV